jgi:hypothetical protein
MCCIARTVNIVIVFDQALSVALRAGHVGSADVPRSTVYHPAFPSSPPPSAPRLRVALSLPLSKLSILLLYLLYLSIAVSNTGQKLGAGLYSWH